MSKRMTVVFKDDNTYTHLKVEAAKRNINASEIVSEAVIEWIDSHEDLELSPLIKSSQEEVKSKGANLGRTKKKFIAMTLKEFNIEISPAAERDLKNLKSKLKNFTNLAGVIDELSLNPRPYGIRKVKGFSITFRIRFSSYRIIYDIYDKDKKIIILRIVKRDKATYRFI